MSAVDSRPTPSQTLQQFFNETAERDHPGDVFELESERMLEVNVKSRVWSKLGAMVAYRGNLTFKREGMLEKGIGTALMKFVSGEMAPLVKIEGQGTAYLADEGKHITVLNLQGESINVNGNDLLAFEESIEYSITMHKKISGMMSGGLFSARLTGTGMVALMSHGRPLTLKVSPGNSLMTDPNSTIAWSGNLAPDLKTDISLRTLMGRGGGETFQMAFHGEGFVVVQPFEEKPVVSAQGR
ncbi:MAG TPA: AIM24 family protein [Abditibacteriaceae bacterium]